MYLDNEPKQIVNLPIGERLMTVVKDTKDLLIDFLGYVEDHEFCERGESIEEFVDIYLKNHYKMPSIKEVEIKTERKHIDGEKIFCPIPSNKELINQGTINTYDEIFRETKWNFTKRKYRIIFRYFIVRKIRNFLR